jgi:hypothetical protein
MANEEEEKENLLRKGSESGRPTRVAAAPNAGAAFSFLLSKCPGDETR